MDRKIKQKSWDDVKQKLHNKINSDIIISIGYSPNLIGKELELIGKDFFYGDKSVATIIDVKIADKRLELRLRPKSEKSMKKIEEMCIYSMRMSSAFPINTKK